MDVPFRIHIRIRIHIERFRSCDSDSDWDCDCDCDSDCECAAVCVCVRCYETLGMNLILIFIWLFIRFLNVERFNWIARDPVTQPTPRTPLAPPSRSRSTAVARYVIMQSGAQRGAFDVFANFIASLAAHCFPLCLREATETWVGTTGGACEVSTGLAFSM